MEWGRMGIGDLMVFFHRRSRIGHSILQWAGVHREVIVHPFAMRNAASAEAMRAGSGFD
jgi:hypothetical protein